MGVTERTLGIMQLTPCCYSWCVLFLVYEGNGIKSAVNDEDAGRGERALLGKHSAYLFRYQAYGDTTAFDLRTTMKASQFLEMTINGSPVSRV